MVTSQKHRLMQKISKLAHCYKQRAAFSRPFLLLILLLPYSSELSTRCTWQSLCTRTFIDSTSDISFCSINIIVSSGKLPIIFFSSLIVIDTSSFLLGKLVQTSCSSTYNVSKKLKVGNMQIGARNLAKTKRRQ